MLGRIALADDASGSAVVIAAVGDDEEAMEEVGDAKKQPVVVVKV